MSRRTLYDPACADLARHFVSIPNDDRFDEQYERDVDRLAQAIQRCVEDELQDIENDRIDGR